MAASPGRAVPGARQRARPPTKVRARDGTIRPFDAARIERAVELAAREVGAAEPALGAKIARAVVDDLASAFPGGLASVEDVQDAIERELMAADLADVARAYVVFRRRRAEVRESKRLLGVRDELKLGIAAVTVLKERYLRRDAHGRVRESTGEMMDRVAGHVAQAEEAYEPGSSTRWADAFARALRGLEFLPNSPTLMNAGTGLGLLSACVVLPVEDSLASLFSALRDAALVHQSGGGTGFSFSHVRPAGDRVASTGGRASGPVSFLKVFDVAAEVVRAGGRRRGASMAVLDVSHPDIVEFARAKLEGDALPSFNLSVAVHDRFMRAVAGNEVHRLVNPRTGRTVATVRAGELFQTLCEAAWASGDPGLVFIDRINRSNPLPSLGRIEATNPCGEVPLLPYESCNLASINLARLVVDGRVDWERLRAVAGLALRFLDDEIDVNGYPVPELGPAALASRKVGLGMMGLAELLAALEVPYDSEEALRLAGRVARTIAASARDASAALASQRGPFPLFAESRFARRGFPPLRNAQLTAVPPTGTVSLIAGTTAGIEPLFAVAYVRNVLGRHLVEVNPLFERVARRRGFYSESLVADIARTGRVGDDPRVPPRTRAAFVTALEIPPAWHLRMQAAVQRYTDAAVSKTVNLSADASVEDVRSIFLGAWRARLKGITVYRYGSKEGQVLTLVGDGDGAPVVRAAAEYAGGCAGRACEF